MRSDDLKPLEAEFTEAELVDWQGAVLDRLGARSSNVDRLCEEVLADLDTVNLGISWWGGTSAKRRILVSDQLVVSARGIWENIRDARLHHLEAQDAWARFAAGFAAAGPGPEPQIVLRTPKAPVDTLPQAFADLHLAGFFRAVGSALDCLAATCVGVVGLPVRILTADFTAVRRYLSRAMAGPVPSVRTFSEWLETAISETGPSGWVDWTLQMRNMLVHRGRRLQLVLASAVAPTLVIPTGERIRLNHLLPKDPGRQQIEVMRDAGGPLKSELREHADDTLTGVFRSVLRFCDLTASELLDRWKLRRASADSPQPLEAQWPDLRPSPSSGFPGYDPNVAVPPGSIRLGPSDTKRLLAAAVMDDRRHLWETMN